MTKKATKITESPFGKSDQWQFNACVGTNGGPYGYMDYALGYFRAGDLLAEDLIKNQGIHIDTLIYPLLYLYRHGIELSLKHFLKNTEQTIQTHKLDVLWKEAEDYIRSLFSEESEEQFALLKEVVEGFCALDPKGEVPRFPEDKEGNLFLQDISIINIMPIYEKMKESEKIIEFLTYCEARNNGEY